MIEVKCDNIFSNIHIIENYEDWSMVLSNLKPIDGVYALISPIEFGTNNTKIDYNFEILSWDTWVVVYDNIPDKYSTQHTQSNNTLIGVGVAINSDIYKVLKLEKI